MHLTQPSVARVILPLDQIYLLCKPTQQSYNRVDLAQSDSSLAAKMKRHSKALSPLHKDDREV